MPFRRPPAASSPHRSSHAPASHQPAHTQNSPSATTSAEVLQGLRQSARAGGGSAHQEARAYSASLPCAFSGS